MDREQREQQRREAGVADEREKQTSRDVVADARARLLERCGRAGGRAGGLGGDSSGSVKIQRSAGLARIGGARERNYTDKQMQ